MSRSLVPSQRELLLYAVAFGCFFQQSVLFPVLPSFATNLGLGVAAVGAVLSVRFFLPAALAAYIGDWSARLGLRRSLVLAALGMAASAFLYLSSGSGATLVLAQVVNGVMYLVAWISAQTFATRMPRREKVVGIFATATAVGMALGPVVGGIALDLGGFNAAFGVYAVGGLLLALNAWGLGEMPSITHSDVPVKGATAGVRTMDILRRPGIQAAFLFSFLCLFMIGLRGNVLPLYLEGAGYSASVIGLVLGAGSLGQAAVRPFTHLLMRSLPLPVTILTAVALAATGIALLPYLAPLAPILVLTFLHGGGAGLHQSLGLVLVADHTNDAERGKAVGLRATVNQIAIAVAPALAGVMAVWIGLGSALTVLSLAILAAGWFVYRLLITRTLAPTSMRNTGLVEAEATQGTSADLRRAVDHVADPKGERI